MTKVFTTIGTGTPVTTKRLVSLSTYRRYINKCIYLSIYDVENNDHAGNDVGNVDAASDDYSDNANTN